MTIADFHYYHYWKNPGWGTPTETLRKVREFSQSDYFANTPPVEGAIQGVKTLKGLGYRLEIVTARALRHQPTTDTWLEKYLPGVIDKVHYTGEFEHSPNVAVSPPPNDPNNAKKVTKASILEMIGAKALIDDSLPNALLCSEVVPVLLFGEYQWNKRPSFDATAQDRMSAALLLGFSVLLRSALLSSSKRTALIQSSEERVLIIGASSGVGRATAVAYAKRGARVAITARRSVVLEQVKQECIKAFNESGHAEQKDTVLAVTADFSDERDMEKVRTAIQRAWSGVDTIVVAAGVSALQPVMSLVEQGGVGRAVTVAVKAIEGNYVGPLVSATTMIPLLESSSKKPAIALISSLAAVVPAPTRAIYCSTKSAGLLLFQSLAIEHPVIKFSNIIPATIEGDFRASAVDGGDVREVLKGALSKEDVAQAIIRAVDTEQRTVWMPSTMRFAPFLYWIWPSFIERKARKKYNFATE
ncbi:Dehydrogenase/reductase SDR family protein 7-like [Rhizoctonia solani AG-1 IB]|uniref:Dehydrogenase/reductase SDR family protein 7-like n=1 Tax=Thanatephorus cucumeris (strain AG1-IB / isolate 7/3/14) TaxID=1108050 RepID=M5BHS2_THACB|nr:Dehydrogenase/reductase SDR family protein 7-like [Rhizoctonia solani AG-1 IB]